MTDCEKKHLLDCPVAGDRQGWLSAGMPEIAVLFVTPDSVYKTIQGVDTYDQARDARTWPGGSPLIAHPPCGTWGSFRRLIKANPDEHRLAIWTVGLIRRWGGILEHPAYSTLWAECNLPRPGQPLDTWGGFTLQVDQFWWGHRARKRTWLYVCGCSQSDVPEIPQVFGRAPRLIMSKQGLRAGMPGYRKKIRKKECLATPEKFAYWLVELARGCSNGGI